MSTEIREPPEPTLPEIIAAQDQLLHDLREAAERHLLAPTAQRERALREAIRRAKGEE